MVRQLIADTGAGTAQAGFELLLPENDCISFGGVRSHTVTLGGAYTGQFPVYIMRLRIQLVSFDHHVRAAALPAAPSGFDGIAALRFLNRFAYGNFGDPVQFGLEV